MNRNFNIDIECSKADLIKLLQKAFQSCNINFLIGSGCSCPAIGALGSIEKEIEKLYKENKESEAEKKLVNFLKPFISSTKQLIDNTNDDNHQKTIKKLSRFH